MDKEYDIIEIDSTLLAINEMLETLGEDGTRSDAELLELLGVEHKLSMKLVDELTELNK